MKWVSDVDEVGDAASLSGLGDGISSGEKDPSKGPKPGLYLPGWEQGHQLTCLPPVLIKLALSCFSLSKNTIHILCLSLVIEFPKDTASTDSTCFPEAKYKRSNLTLTGRLRTANIFTVGAQDN